MLQDRTTKCRYTTHTGRVKVTLDRDYTTVYLVYNTSLTFGGVSYVKNVDEDGYESVHIRSWYNHECRFAVLGLFFYIPRFVVKGGDARKYQLIYSLAQYFEAVYNKSAYSSRSENINFTYDKDTEWYHTYIWCASYGRKGVDDQIIINVCVTTTVPVFSKHNFPSQYTRKVLTGVCSRRVLARREPRTTTASNLYLLHATYTRKQGSCKTGRHTLFSLV